MLFCTCRTFPSPYGKEVGSVETVFTFILSVAAGVVSNCISKWLDDQFKAGKH